MLYTRQFTGKKEIGHGTYSRVYCAKDKNGNPVAIKRRFASSGFNFSVGMREHQINAALSNHPHIIDLKGFTLGNPFAGAPLSPLGKVKEMRDDTIHFVYPLAEGDLFDVLVKEKKLSAGKIMIYMAQLLLGLEYIHAMGFIHRDIKIDNLLIHNKKIKIADFGLAKPVNSNCPQTPGVMTSWYRAPEICLGYPHYTEKADLWSAGAVLFELLTGEPPTGRIVEKKSNDDSKSEDQLLITAILERLPYKISSVTRDKYDVRGMLKNVEIEHLGMTWDHYLGLEDEQRRAEFEANGGAKNLKDLLRGLLSFDPDNRLSATQALDLPYFDMPRLRNYINARREQFTVEYSPTPAIVLPEKTQERIWMGTLARSIFRRRAHHVWYSHRILFHAISIFDRLLVYKLNEAVRMGKRLPKPTPYTGQYMTREQAELYFIACVYLSVKYWQTIQPAINYLLITTTKYRSKEKQTIVGEYENEIIRYVLDFKFYSETPFDILSRTRKYTDEDVVSLLTFIVQGHYSGRNSMSAFRFWCNNAEYYLKNNLLKK